MKKKKFSEKSIVDSFKWEKLLFNFKNFPEFSKRENLDFPFFPKKFFREFCWIEIENTFIQLILKWETRNVLKWIWEQLYLNRKVEKEKVSTIIHLFWSSPVAMENTLFCLKKHAVHVLCSSSFLLWTLIRILFWLFKLWNVSRVNSSYKTATACFSHYNDNTTEMLLKLCFFKIMRNNVKLGPCDPKVDSWNPTQELQVRWRTSKEPRKK